MSKSKLKKKHSIHTLEKNAKYQFKLGNIKGAKNLYKIIGKYSSHDGIFCALNGVRDLLKIKEYSHAFEIVQELLENNQFNKTPNSNESRQLKEYMKLISDKVSHNVNF